MSVFLINTFTGIDFNCSSVFSLSDLYTSEFTAYNSLICTFPSTVAIL